ncbi:hypothetical protein ABK040_009204 [Willaertia magna]
MFHSNSNSTGGGGVVATTNTTSSKNINYFYRKQIDEYLYLANLIPDSLLLMKDDNNTHNNNNINNKDINTNKDINNNNNIDNAIDKESNNNNKGNNTAAFNNMINNNNVEDNNKINNNNYNDKEMTDSQLLFELIKKNKDYLNKYIPTVLTLNTLSMVSNYVTHIYNIYLYGKGLFCKAKTYLTIGIWYKNNLIGLIAIQNIDLNNHWIEIGYWIGEEFQGKGIVTKSLSFFCKDILGCLNFCENYQDIYNYQNNNFINYNNNTPNNNNINFNNDNNNNNNINNNNINNNDKGGILSFHVNKCVFKVAVDNEKSVKVCERIGAKREALFRKHEFYHNEYHDIYMYGLLKEDLI